MPPLQHALGGGSLGSEASPVKKRPSEASMLDHITFGVADFGRASAFYDQALAPLGLKRLVNVTAEQSGGTAFAGYGEDRPYFWIGEGRELKGRLHVAFAAESRAVVDAFY